MVNRVVCFVGLVFFLCAVSPVPTSPNHFPSPTSFYEYDPIGNAFTQISGPTGLTYASPSYIMRMLDLPDGSVLLATSDTQLYLYRPDGSPLAAGKPVISNLVQNADGSFHVAGKLFNGITEGAAYGDDAQMDSNYPIVRFTSGVSVYYARTYNWTNYGVATGSTTQRTIPDVSLNAGTLVPVYDSYDFGAGTPWNTEGGTSLASPSLAGILNRTGNKLGSVFLNPVTGNNAFFSNGENSLLYAQRGAQKMYKSNFFDVKTGSNGVAAVANYDTCTGVGAPRGLNGK